MFDNILVRVCLKAATTHLSCLRYWEWWACFWASGKQSFPLWSTPRVQTAALVPELSVKKAATLPATHEAGSQEEKGEAVPLHSSELENAVLLTWLILQLVIEWSPKICTALIFLTSLALVSLERRNWNHKPLLETPAVLLDPLITVGITLPVQFYAAM